MYMLVMAIVLVPLGALADRLGRKKIFGMGLWLYTLASLLGAVAHHFAPLLICRGLQGVGAGMFISTGMAILTSVFPPKRRGRVIGIYVAAVYIGLSAGPFVGGLLTGFWGWRCLFWLMLPLLTSPERSMLVMLALVRTRNTGSSTMFPLASPTRLSYEKNDLPPS